MTAYELVQKRARIQVQLHELSSKSNGPMGRDKALWDCMGRMQEQIRRIDETLKSIVIR